MELFSSRQRKRTLYRRFRELAWVGGCVTAPAARTSPGRWRGSQPRAPWYFGSIRTAHHGGHGAVDIVGPVAPPGHARGLGNAGVYTNRRKWPLGIVLGHLCTLLRFCRQMWGRRSVHRSAKMASLGCFGAFVYTVATREGHARVVPPLGWRLCRSSNPHKPPKEPPIETGQQVPGTHRRKVWSLSARRAPLVRREMRQAH